MTTILGADRRAGVTFPTCRRCEMAVTGAAKIDPLTGGLIHRECFALVCSVCGIGAANRSELDASGRCDECRP